MDSLTRAVGPLCASETSAVEGAGTSRAPNEGQIPAEEAVSFLESGTCVPSASEMFPGKTERAGPSGTSRETRCSVPWECPHLSRVPF